MLKLEMVDSIRLQARYAKGEGDADYYSLMQYEGLDKFDGDERAVSRVGAKITLREPSSRVRR